MSLSENARLTRPSALWRDEFMEMVDEYQAAGEARYRKVRQAGNADFSTYVRQLEDASRGIYPRRGYVPQTTYWLVLGARLLGESRLRHYLTPELEAEAGHIGYGIRPSERCKGCGTLILALTLKEAQALGLRRVLVTCDADNIASARVIQKNGGILSDEVVSSVSGRLISRYWFELS